MSHSILFLLPLVVFLVVFSIRNKRQSDFVDSQKDFQSQDTEFKRWS